MNDVEAIHEFVALHHDLYNIERTSSAKKFDELTQATSRLVWYVKDWRVRGQLSTVVSNLLSDPPAPVLNHDS